ncbi:MAG: siroheme synthase [Alphaproteobacteria bacterium]|nr:siroheme synthase [Alphaproteobacteria bacterium]
MLPMTLDLTGLRLALVGAGAPALRRLERLDAAAAVALAVYAPRPSHALAAAAGRRLVARLPADGELAAAQIVFVSGLAAADAGLVAARARTAGAIVHVEDAPEISDAQLPAVLHRGDLAIAVSTRGRSPGLAAELKRALGRIIGPEWAARLDEAADERRRWRDAGLGPAVVAERTAAWLGARRWLASATVFESHWAPGAAANDAAPRRVGER